MLIIRHNIDRYSSVKQSASLLLMCIECDALLHDVLVLPLCPVLCSDVLYNQGKYILSAVIRACLLLRSLNRNKNINTLIIYVWLFCFSFAGCKIGRASCRERV